MSQYHLGPPILVRSCHNLGISNLSPIDFLNQTINILQAYTDQRCAQITTNKVEDWKLWVPLQHFSQDNGLTSCLYQFYLRVSRKKVFLVRLNFGEYWKHTKTLSYWFNIVQVYWLIRREGSVQTPGQTPKRKYDKIFLRRLPFSRFLAKTLRVNKIAMKSFSKNFNQLCIKN